MTSSSKRIILDTFCRFINSEVKLPTLASRLPFEGAVFLHLLKQPVSNAIK